jgi:hypothetical protein
MSVDNYTRATLTVIALCLVWLCLTTTASPLRAQPQTPEVASGPPQPVVIVGWGKVDRDGRVTLEPGTWPPEPIPVKVTDYSLPTRPIDVRLDYSDTRPMPVGITQIHPAGEWAPIRSKVEEEPARPRPGGK